MTSKLAFLATLSLTACVDQPIATEDTASELAETDPAAIGLLRLVNIAPFAELDDTVGLDRRAAENIVAHRDGADGVRNTADDNRFDTVAELDAIAFVGPATLDKLTAYALTYGFDLRHRAPGDGTVIDQDSGLVWHQQGLGPVTYPTAIGNFGPGTCKSSTIAGRVWRLPTRAELLTLVDKSFFPNHDPLYLKTQDATGHRSYWTSELFPGDSGFAYTVDFAGGFVSAEWTTKTKRDVRCVSN